MFCAVGVWLVTGHFEEKASNMLNDLSLKACQISKAENIISLFYNTKYISIPVDSRENFDVSCTGDTVMARLAGAVAVGADLESTEILSNVAGGIVFDNFGTTSIALNELAAQDFGVKLPALHLA